MREVLQKVQLGKSGVLRRRPVLRELHACRRQDLQGSVTAVQASATILVARRFNSLSPQYVQNKTVTVITP